MPGVSQPCGYTRFFASHFGSPVVGEPCAPVPVVAPFLTLVAQVPAPATPGVRGSVAGRRAGDGSAAVLPGSWDCENRKAKAVGRGSELRSPRELRRNAPSAQREEAMRSILVLAGCACALFAPVSRLQAQTTPVPAGEPSVGVTVPAFAFGTQSEAQQNPKKPSPWLLLPLVSSGPKMGTSFGFLGSYLHYFDPEVPGLHVRPDVPGTAPPSRRWAAVFARTSFAEDSQRVEGVVAYALHQERVQGLHGLGPDVPDDGRSRSWRRAGISTASRGRGSPGPRRRSAATRWKAETDLQNKVAQYAGSCGFQSGASAWS